MPEKNLEVLERYHKTRSRSLFMTQTLQPEDYVIQTMECMSPPRWHLGHTSWFFEMVLQQMCPGFKAFNLDFHWFFNSYYDRFGTRIERPKRGTKSRPTVKETMRYRSYVDEQVEHFLRTLPCREDQVSEALHLFELGIEHETQHQELLIYDIKHLLLDLFETPFPENTPRLSLPEKDQKLSTDNPFVSFDAGLIEVGAKPEHGFAFDNEMPCHRVFLEPFSIASKPVTCGEYLQFVKDGGYQNVALWHNDGWKAVQKEELSLPLYWERDGDEYFSVDFQGKHELSESNREPICHVSYYEASAYARWAGARLPTEFEWERAATTLPSQAGSTELARPGVDASQEVLASNLLNAFQWSTVSVDHLPDAKTASGLWHMFGNVWEWTSSDYCPYPGYETIFAEYNDKWMCNQRVLRGGSFATWGSHLRPTYRNYFYPQERWMLSGFRLAKSGRG